MSTLYPLELWRIWELVWISCIWDMELFCIWCGRQISTISIGLTRCWDRRCCRSGLGSVVEAAQHCTYGCWLALQQSVMEVPHFPVMIRSLIKSYTSLPLSTSKTLLVFSLSQCRQICSGTKGCCVKSRNGWGERGFVGYVAQRMTELG